MRWSFPEKWGTTRMFAAISHPMQAWHGACSVHDPHRCQSTLQARDERTMERQEQPMATFQDPNDRIQPPIQPRHVGDRSSPPSPPRRTELVGAADAYEVEVQGACDLVCLSHLRWDFVFQRPQHLLTRFARGRRVFVIEEPVCDGGDRDRLDCSVREGGVVVATPHLPPGLSERASHDRQRLLINELFREREIGSYVLWYYTPMAMPFTKHLFPALAVYDCMDELAAFHGAPPEMREREEQLLAWADLVFTGGHSLYDAKRGLHDHVHAFPSSIDHAHFAKARRPQGIPDDQAVIPHPRIGFYGVLDERLDLELLDAAAAARPDWHWVMIGPVVKIDPLSLPKRANIHYLGKKDYGQLPNYLAGWDAAILPFARNESTRFISPTKTPEYLAAGRPVVSTSIRDVVEPYGSQGLIEIADRPDEFVAALERALAAGDRTRWRRQVDEFLAGSSWDKTQAGMQALMAAAMSGNARAASGDSAAARRTRPTRLVDPA
jgi:glycosyltransferase involved in cell wall biosynthesis